MEEKEGGREGGGRKLGLYAPKLYVVKKFVSFTTLIPLAGTGHVINVSNYFLNKQIKTQHIKFCFVD